MNEKENRFIVLLIKNEINSEEREEAVNIISRKPAWDYMLSKSIELDLAPMVYFNLKTLSKNYPEVLEVIPEHIAEELKKKYYINISKNSLAYKELSKILNSFNQAEIPVVLLKGIVFAEFFYQNRGLRSMVDIDILVRKEHLELSGDILRKLGYHPRVDNIPKESYYRENHHHLVPYLSENKLVQVEIHHNLIPNSKPHSIDLSRVWEGAKAVNIVGTKALTLRPEDMLLHLCLHLSLTDMFLGKLRGLSDVSEIIKQCGKNLNWDQILSESKEYRIINYMYYTLWIVKELLSAEIPDEVLDHLKESKSTRYIEDKVLKSLITRYVFVADQSGNFIPIAFISLLSKKLIGGTNGVNILIILFGTIIESFKNSIVNKYQGRKLKPIYVVSHLIRVFFKYSWIKFEKR